MVSCPHWMPDDQSTNESPVAGRRVERSMQAATNIAAGGRMTDVNNDGRDTAVDALMVIQPTHLIETEVAIRRPLTNQAPATIDPRRPRPQIPPAIWHGSSPASTDATNNLEKTPSSVFSKPGLGAFFRATDANYADGNLRTCGERIRPSAREIQANVAFRPPTPRDEPDSRYLSSFVFAVGPVSSTIDIDFVLGT